MSLVEMTRGRRAERKEIVAAKAEELGTSITVKI